MSLVMQDNLSVQVAQWLAEKIIKADYPAGSRIMEAKVSDELGISRGPIREALLILQKQRLIKILPRRGAVVTELSTSQIKDLYEVMTTLYSSLAENIANNWQADDLAPLTTLLTTMKKAAEKGDHKRYFQYTIDIIRLGYPVANNTLLQEFIEDLIPSVYRVQYRSIQQRQTDLLAHWHYYDQFITHIKKRDIKKLTNTIKQFGQQEQQLAYTALAETTSN